ncbi:hypothetical protein [Cellulomonas sp. NPDC058312]|uniref:hypothetical protein n=1 Tax=Cellulomonas sp. NPDC058312 TaxID=3346441 RepID=UPI0036F11EF2
MEPTTPFLPAPRHPRARGRLAVAAVLGAVALLAGCGGADDASPGASAGASPGSTAGATPTPTGLEPVAGSTAPGLPDGAGPAPADAGAGAGRATDEGLLHVVTFGSSTCPAVPDDTAESTGPAAVTVTFPEPGDGPCTADLVPTTTVVALPAGTDPTSDLVVTIGTNGQVTLPAGSTDLVWVLPAG